VLDNEQIGKVKHCLRAPKVAEDHVGDAVKMIRKVLSSSNRLYARHARKAIHSGDVSVPYLFEDKGYDDRVIEKAAQRLAELEALPAPYLDASTIDKIFREVPGILPGLRMSA
jgi:hypothetical protein